MSMRRGRMIARSIVTGAMTMCLAWTARSIAPDNAIANVRVNAASLKRLAMLEITFDAGTRRRNPYDPEEIEAIARFIGPGGESEKVDGFWYEGFSRNLRDGKEMLARDGSAAWKIRYTPRAPGTYRYSIELVDHAAAASSRYPAQGHASFTVTASADKGFLKIAAADPAYLEYSNGDLFLGFGHNLCGWEWPGKYIDAAWNGTDNAAGTFDFDRWLEALSASGGNLTQFDFGESDQLEWTEGGTELPFAGGWKGLTEYNQQTAWKMDRRIQEAERRGVYFRLTLLHWEDFDDETGAAPDWGWNRNPYNAANNGPARDVSEFFAGAASVARFKKTARYVNARWGYSPRLLAYELWNEADAPGMVWGNGRNYDTEAANVRRWHAELSAYLKGIDPYGHLVTTSFADSRRDDAVWRLPGIGLTTIHRYTHYNPEYGDARYDTVPTVRKLVAERLASVPKPVIVGEFALSPGGDVQRVRDPEGIEFHHQLWASLFAGAAATAMHWNWGSYIHRNDLYRHYTPLAAFFRGAELRKASRFDNLSDPAARVQYLGLIAAGKAYVWIRDKNHAFAGSGKGRVPATVAGQTVPVRLPDGDYRVEFHDTYTGELIAARPARSNGGLLSIDVPDFKRDIAVKIMKRQGAGSPEKKTQQR